MDRLGNLPSSIIESILCLVPIQEAARTSILSREWSLTSLYLQEVDFSTVTLKHLLSNCPLLKTLDIRDPCISGSIDGPTISEIFKCLPVIEKFSISFELIRVFRDIAIHEVPRELSTTLIHLKYLGIDGVYFFSKTELSVLALLIKSSPNLEKLKVWDHSNLDMSKRRDYFRVEDYSDIMLERLNELEITSFINAKNQLDFVRLILARSPVLKKVRIFPFFKIRKKEKSKIKSQILEDSISYPCASPEGYGQAQQPSVGHNRIDPMSCTNSRGRKDKYPVQGVEVFDNSKFEISKRYCFRVEDYSDIMLERLNELEITSFINAKNQLDFVRLILARSPLPTHVHHQRYKSLLRAKCASRSVQTNKPCDR
nr:hypothetical protein [Tanacetum cinerariifolium]